MSRFANLLFVAFAVIALAGLATAQEEQIALGDTVTGSIDDAAPEHRYAFDAAAGDVVTIAHTVTSGDLDPLLILADAAGTILTRDDDSGEGRSSLIQAFEVPADGTYVIIATRYDMDLGETSGEFTLSLGAEGDVAPPPAETELPASDEELPTEEAAADPFGALPALDDTETTLVNMGVPVEGAIDDAAWRQFWYFGGEAGDEVTLSLERTGGDLVLQAALFDRSGETALLESEDIDGIGALMLSHTLPETAYYIVGVSRADGETGTTNGMYTLAISSEAGPPAAETGIDISLTWNTGADLDLVLYYPAANQSASIHWQHVFNPANYPLPEGVTFDGDNNGTEFCPQNPQPAERLTWDETAPAGSYEILVIYRHPCDAASEPVEFTLSYTVDGQTETITGTVAPPDGEYRAAFTR